MKRIRHGHWAVDMPEFIIQELLRTHSSQDLSSFIDAYLCEVLSNDD
ncbi:histidyl-tRNA synthetase, mitochondrial precursor [Aspergillus luchuensis]|uniref:Histidyl-tRNA synthetase, mitochondrial n=1 Tax=Aspergillus kawachii TaxID=1069201 RepID=A0A146FXY7_ASPKA|nr:histidyl-tRNA synthetase, mitochondrial precursor [Aspergillus luchuensis]